MPVVIGTIRQKTRSWRSCWLACIYSQVLDGRAPCVRRPRAVAAPGWRALAAWCVVGP